MPYFLASALRSSRVQSRDPIAPSPLVGINPIMASKAVLTVVGTRELSEKVKYAG